MRPAHVFEAGCGVPEPLPGVPVPPGAGVEVGDGLVGDGAGDWPLPAVLWPPPVAKRSVSVRRAVVFSPPARRRVSLIVARPFAARSASMPFALKRSVSVLTDSLRSFT